MSSLGFQSLYRLVNQTPGRAAHRAFLPDDIEAFRSSRTPLFTYEGDRPVADYPVVALSVAYELEIAGLIQALELAGIPPLAEDRDERHPFILAGGPLTFSNPLPLAPYVDCVLMGEAEESLPAALDVLFGVHSKAEALVALRSIESAFLPSEGEDWMPPVAKADDALIPARSQILTPHTELRDMFLIEPERGCHRGCTYCVMRRPDKADLHLAGGGMRTVEPDSVLGLVPPQARRVGLVGAAVTDHPRIKDVVRALVEDGRGIGISSLRADRLDDEFAALLQRLYPAAHGIAHRGDGIDCDQHREGRDGGQHGGDIDRRQPENQGMSREVGIGFHPRPLNLEADHLRHDEGVVAPEGSVVQRVEVIPGDCLKRFIEGKQGGIRDPSRPEPRSLQEPGLHFLIPDFVFDLDEFGKYGATIGMVAVKGALANQVTDSPERISANRRLDIDNLIMSIVVNDTIRKVESLVTQHVRHDLHGFILAKHELVGSFIGDSG